jgi:hypothetical protein
MTKSLLICTKLQVGPYVRRGGQRDSSTRVFNIKGEGVINIKILRKKIFVVEWSETTDMQTMFTQRTKIEVALPLVEHATFNSGELIVHFAPGSARSMVGAQPWNRAKQQRDKCQWLKDHSGPALLSNACMDANKLVCILHNTEAKIRKDLKCILETSRSKECEIGRSRTDSGGQKNANSSLTSTPSQSTVEEKQKSPSDHDDHHDHHSIKKSQPRKRGSFHLETSEPQLIRKRSRGLTNDESLMVPYLPAAHQLPTHIVQHHPDGIMSTSPNMLSPQMMSHQMILNGMVPGFPSFQSLPGMPGMTGIPGGLTGMNMNGLNGMGGMTGMHGMNGMNGMNGMIGMNGLSANSDISKSHQCNTNARCQSCSINICTICSVVAGCGCGPFCNSCFQYSDTCDSCGHTQCEHCVLNSLDGKCDCHLTKASVLSKFDAANKSLADYNFFADWEY